MSRKIRIFLSGIVNSTNAQNLNCRALMKYLDPAKLEVRALTVYSGNLGLPEVACASTMDMVRVLLLCPTRHQSHSIRSATPREFGM